MSQTLITQRVIDDQQLAIAVASCTPVKGPGVGLTVGVATLYAVADQTPRDGRPARGGE